MSKYNEAGVSIDKGNELVNKIKTAVKSTYTKDVISPIGGFAAIFNAEFKEYKKPRLVTSTDGVGTKLKIAFMANKHDTIGIDLVGMSVNDVLVYGAKPLFFLDYFAVGSLDVDVAYKVIQGIAKGCQETGCALVGGETAEMPSFYQKGEYDCAGFVVGVVDEDKIIDGKNVKEGDVIIGLDSSGFHSNGYSLVRHVFFEKNKFDINHVFKELGKPLSEVLLEPTILYVKPILNLINKIKVKAMCHITGGGIVENLPRVLPNNVSAVIDVDKINIQEIFRLTAKLGQIEKEEMFRVFNMGVGFVVVVSKEDVSETIKLLSPLKARVIGTISKKLDKEVVLEGIDKLKL